MLTRLCDGCYSLLGKYTPWIKRFAPAALLMAALTFVLVPPAENPILGWHPMPWWEDALEWKLLHPLSLIPAEEFAKGGLHVKRGDNIPGHVSHLHKCDYRVTIPLVAYSFGWHLRAAEIFALLLSLAFPAAVLLHTRRMLPDDPPAAFLLAMAIAFASPYQMAADDPSNFDSIGYVLLALAAYLRSPPLIGACLIVGGFTDERVILAAPLLYLLQGPSLLPNGRQWGIISGVSAFVPLRLLLNFYLGKHFEASMIGEQLLFYLLMLPIELLIVYKGALFVLASGLWQQARTRASAAFLMVLAALPGVMASLLVVDMGRSLGYTLPLLLLCTRSLCASAEPSTIRKVAFWGALVSLSIPVFLLLPG